MKSIRKKKGRSCSSSPWVETSVNRFSICLLSLSIAACGGDATAAQRPGSGVPFDTTLVISDDPELRALAIEFLPGLAARSGLPLLEPVRLVRRTRAELERFLEVKLAEEMPPEREAALVRAYAMLGLVPGDLELKALLQSVYMEQVAGFYDPDSTALFVLDDQPAATLSPLLLHELVHAVQDQSVDLAAITAPEVGNDRRAAASAAIEGHATLIMFEQMTEEMQGGPVDLGDIPDFAGQIRPALEMARSQYPELARAPRVIQESLLFPYLEGAGFVQRLWSDLPERTAPFGDWLPASTEQVLNPERFFGTPRDEPTELLITLDGGIIVHEDVLGAAELAVFMAEHTDGGSTTGWDGDRYVLFEAGGESGLVWASVWDSPGDRDRFVSQLTPGLSSFPGGGRLESLDFAGRPGAVLTVGAAAGFSVTTQGGGQAP